MSERMSEFVQRCKVSDILRLGKQNGFFMAFFVNQCHAQAVLEKYGFRAKTIVLWRHDVFADVNGTLTDKCCFGWF